MIIDQVNHFGNYLYLKFQMKMQDYSISNFSIMKIKKIINIYIFLEIIIFENAFTFEKIKMIITYFIIVHYRNFNNNIFYP